MSAAAAAVLEGGGHVDAHRGFLRERFERDTERIGFVMGDICADEPGNAAGYAGAEVA